MGATRTALEALTTGGGFEYRLVLALEGIPYLITNGSTTDALTAWAGTDWSSAIGGLVVSEWGCDQTIRPWDKQLKPMHLTVGIQPDANDVFGVLAFNTSGGVETRLTTALDCDDTSVVVQRCTDFAASGEIHIGTECLAYSSKNDGTKTLAVSKRGKYHPLRASGFGRPHPLPTFESGVNLRPAVTSLPRVWAGRWFTLHLHRVVGGVWDSLAEAQRIMAGRIAGAPRDDENGWTWLDLEEVRGAVRDTVLMRDQWTAEIAEGISVVVPWNNIWPDGMRASSRDTDGSVLRADPLVVVDSGAASDYEWDAGRYTYDEVLDHLNGYMQTAHEAGGVDYRAELSLVAMSDGGGFRTQLLVSAPTAGARSYGLNLPKHLWQMLGWPEESGFLAFPFDSIEHKAISPAPPLRALLYLSGGTDPLNPPVIQVQNEAGTFFDNYDYLPVDIALSLDDFTENVGLFLVDGSFLVAQKVDDTLIPIPFVDDQPFLKLLGGLIDSGALVNPELSTSGPIVIKQVAIIAGRFRRIVEWLLLSTGTDSYNGAQDVLPLQLGAGIPSELLGDTFDQDLLSLDSATADLMVVIEKPTKLWDVLVPEFLLRAAALVWKGDGGDDGNGGLRMTRWSTPTSQTSLHTFTEADKAEPDGVRANHRTPTLDEDAYCFNLVKVFCNRLLRGASDTYDRDLSVVDVASMEEQGQRSVELKARNTFAGTEHAGGDVVELVSEIAGWMPLFGRPMRFVRRSISPDRFLSIAPGDHCVVTDYHVRNPATGKRKGQDGDAGLAGYPGLIIAVRVDWGGFQGGGRSPKSRVGEVDILIFPSNRLAPYSPCAQLASYTAGTKTITCDAHAHSSTGQAADAANFQTGDAIVVVERDPSNPAAPLSWSRNVASQTGNTIVHDDVALGTGGGETAYDATKSYMVISAKYTSSQATQKTDCYQADDADGLIQDLAQPYEYAFHSDGHVFAEDDPATNVALYADVAYGDGQPLDTGYEKDLCQIINNAVSYRTAPSTPSMHTAKSVAATPAAGIRSLKRILPIVMHPGDLARGDRYLWVAPVFNSDDGSSAAVRISLCRTLPTGNSLVVTDEDNPEYQLGPVRESHTWTSTSTSEAPGAAYPFHFRSLDAEGEGWLVVELYAHAEFRGLAEVRAGRYLEA